MNWKRTSIFLMGVLLVAPMMFAQLTGTVDFTATKQQIDGFGVAATFGRSWFIQSATGNVPSAVMDQLFNPQTGAGISIVRLGIDDVLGSGASSGGNNANSGILIVNGDPGSCTTTPTYTWDHSAGGEIWLSQQAVKYGVNRFYADSWGAPGYMKTNNRIDAGGVVCDGTSSTVTGGNHCTKSGYNDCRAAYSNYMLQYLKFYLQDGVPVTDINWINEPNANTTYASMTPTSAQAINFLNVYGPTMRNSGIKVNLVCCDVYNWSTANTFNTAIVNDATNSFVDIYSAHEYGQVANFVLNTGTPKKKNWMTEWGPASPNAWNPYWDNRFAGTNNNYNDGMFVANDIANALNKGQISAYIYWYADSTSTTGAMIEMGGPWVNGQAYQAWPYSTYTVPARLYALAHFARNVRPGAYQATVTTNSPNCTNITQGVGNCIVTSAFVNPNGSKVITVVNNYTTAQTLNLTLDAGTADWVPSAYVTNVNTIPDAVANSAAPPATNSAIALTPGLATVSGPGLTANLPARSMVSIVLAAPAVAGTVNLVVRPTFTAQGDGSVSGKVQVSNLGTGTAQNVTLTTATFGSAAGTTLPTAPMPYTIGDIAPGTTQTFTVNFAAGQMPGMAVAARFGGTYDSLNGSGSFTSSTRASVPALPSFN